MEAMKIRPELAPREIVEVEPLSYVLGLGRMHRLYLTSSHDDDNELALVDPPKRKKRGLAKLKDKPTEPFKVEFDKNGRAIGKH
nr:hypothetical protein [Tanacetum cinerariifolium]